MRYDHVLAAAFGAAIGAGMTQAAELEARVYKDAGGKALPYRLLKPIDYDAKTAYPLVIFLHGAGERGTDNKAQMVHGVSDFAKDENLKKHPCFLIAPQCPNGKKWCEVDWGAAS